MCTGFPGNTGNLNRRPTGTRRTVAFGRNISPVQNGYVRLPNGERSSGKHRSIDPAENTPAKGMPLGFVGRACWSRSKAIPFPKKPPLQREAGERAAKFFLAHVLRIWSDREIPTRKPGCRTAVVCDGFGV
ncbi:MAG: hypothetical protein RLZZ253_2120 [Verrucomicrobiota bacterium]|jgi:hypothetical protein